MTDPRPRLTMGNARVGPSDCRERQRELGMPYPRSSCHHCGPIIRPNWRCPYETGIAVQPECAPAPLALPAMTPELVAALRKWAEALGEYIGNKGAWSVAPQSLVLLDCVKATPGLLAPPPPRTTDATFWLGESS